MADLSVEHHGNNKPARKENLEHAHPHTQYDICAKTVAQEGCNPPKIVDDPLRPTASLEQQLEIADRFHKDGLTLSLHLETSSNAILILMLII